MNTVFMLMAQYDAKVLIPLRRVCADFFEHLSPEQLTRKIAAGEICLPLIRLDGSPKAPVSIYLLDLAAYIDAQRSAAQARSVQSLQALEDQRAAGLDEVLLASGPALAESASDLIRLPEVIKLIGLCKAGIYKMIRDGNFPRQVKLGDRAVAWIRGEVLEWRRQRIDASRRTER